MIRRIVTAVTVAMLLTACGGESEPAEPKASATPRSYTLEELEAALPGKDDVAGVSSVNSSCPADGEDTCWAPEEGEQVGTDLKLTPPGDSAAEVEKAAHESIFGDSVSVYAWLHASSSDAAKNIEDAQADHRKYDGVYDILQKGDIKTGATPAEKGEGSVENLEVEAWSGQILSRRGTMSVDDESEPRLIAQAEVSQGAVTVMVYVNVHQDGRSVDYAAKLVRKVLADYLERLG